MSPNSNSPGRRAASSVGHIFLAFPRCSINRLDEASKIYASVYTLAKLLISARRTPTAKRPFAGSRSQATKQTQLSFQVLIRIESTLIYFTLPVRLATFYGLQRRWRPKRNSNGGSDSTSLKLRAMLSEILLCWPAETQPSETTTTGRPFGFDDDDDDDYDDYDRQLSLLSLLLPPLSSWPQTAKLIPFGLAFAFGRESLRLLLLLEVSREDATNAY